MGEFRGPRTPGRCPRRSAARLAAAAALAFLELTGAAALAEPPAVEIQDSKYLPPEVTVAPGTTVRWISRDEDVHTVTSVTGVFASPGLALGEADADTFPAPGTYAYTCDLHPFMQSTVSVK